MEVEPDEGTESRVVVRCRRLLGGKAVVVMILKEDGFVEGEVVGGEVRQRAEYDGRLRWPAGQAKGVGDNAQDSC